MADETEKQVTRNTIDIEGLKKASGDTLVGVNKLCETMDEDRKQNRKSFDGIDKLLRGKDAENPGIVVQIDRLENSSNRLDKKIKNVIGASVTAMVAMGATVLSWVLGFIGKGD